ncbi:MAG: AraC family transcriptional regulator [Deltaproteobacteria bacterium]|nr:MAG: AraC family transcriptional regulator [Deltaproteobacteria bacterium]
MQSQETIPPGEFRVYQNEASSEAPGVLLSGGFSFSEDRKHPLLSPLPPLNYLGTREKQELPWLEQTIQFLMVEATQGEHGADLMVERLMEMLFIQVIRSWVSSQVEGEGSWLGALRDEVIHASMALIHQQPEKPWTVESLGRAVGLSRSSFAARFQSRVGVPPLRYLTQWRMRVATQLLQKHDYAGLSHVAWQVGYDSEISFSRAF